MSPTLLEDPDRAGEIVVSDAKTEMLRGLASLTFKSVNSLLAVAGSTLNRARDTRIAGELGRFAAKWMTAFEERLQAPQAT